jgi:hypothetical protein
MTIADDVYDCIIEFDRKIIGVDFDGQSCLGRVLWDFFPLLLLLIDNGES